jgi:hypothetical protein
VRQDAVGIARSELHDNRLGRHDTDGTGERRGRMAGTPLASRSSVATNRVNRLRGKHVRRVVLSFSILVATLAGTLAMAVPAQAHNNGCHTQYFCPSDSHRYIWYGDAFGPYGSTYSAYDPWAGYAYDPWGFYTGYDPYGYYGYDPSYMRAGYGWSPWSGYGSGSGWGWGGYGSGWSSGGYWGGWGGWGGYGGYYGAAPQWYRYSWSCADLANARGNEAYVAYFAGREYRCDPAY